MYSTALIAQTVLLFSKNLYLYPGGTIAPILHECKSSGVSLVCAKTEQGAGYMAIAEASISHRPSFVTVTSGPGATNLITCIADAYYDSLPLVVFTGQVGTRDLERSKTIRQRGFQEVPIINIVSYITKKVWQPKTIDELQSALIDGVLLASTGRPGPVLIDLPISLQTTELDQTTHEKFITQLNNKVIISKNDEEKIQNEPLLNIKNGLSKAQRPLLLVGGGAIKDAESIRILAEQLQIPVICSLRGIGIMPTHHPLSVGWIGHTGLPWANKTLYAADCILVLGSRLDVRQTGTELDVYANKTIFQVDIDEAEMAHGRIPQTIQLRCSIKTFLKDILAIGDKNFIIRDKWLKEIDGFRVALPLADHGEAPGVAPDELLRYIDRKINNQSFAVVTGVGLHQQWAARYFNFDSPRKLFLTSAGHGTMGFALPVALGLSRLQPKRLILCIDGDGSFQMNIQELALISELKVAPKIVVLDNNRLGIVSQFQRITFGDDPVTGDFHNPDFCAIASAYGISTHRLETFNTLIIEEFLQEQGPSLLHVKVQHDAPLSPMLLSGQTLDKMWYR
jgi:acetolactate synthase I/II/III large subunit